MEKSYEVSATEDVKQSGSKVHQVITSIIACLPVLSYGTAMGWISPHQALLMSPASPAQPPLTAGDISWMASVIFICAPLSVLAYGAAADRFGRKYTLLCVSLPMALGWIVKLCSSQSTALIGARALMGVGAGGAYVVCPLYVKEISDDDIRGMTGTFVIFSQSVGNLLVFVLGDVAEYRAVLWTLLVPPLLHALLALRLPDTPAYLVQRGRHQEAARVLSWLRSVPESHKLVAKELHRLQVEQDTRAPGFAPKLLFKDAVAMKAFRVALIVNLAREFCGCIAVLVYASHVFAAADVHKQQLLTPNQQSILLACVQIAGSFIACQLVDRVGRKPLLSVSSAVAGCSMCLLGAWFYVQRYSSDEEASLPGWLPPAALCVSILADAAALQPLPFVILTEMFNFQLRGTVATIIMATHLFVDFCLLKLFTPLISWIGYHSTFWIFSGVCFANLTYLLLFLPETKMRSLDAIYRDLQRPTMCCIDNNESDNMHTDTSHTDTQTTTQPVTTHTDSSPTTV